jgi:hypothetical protein
MTHFAFVNNAQIPFVTTLILTLIDKCKMCHFECHSQKIINLNQPCSNRFLNIWSTINKLCQIRAPRISTFRHGWFKLKFLKSLGLVCVCVYVFLSLRSLSLSYSHHQNILNNFFINQNIKEIRSLFWRKFDKIFRNSTKLRFFKNFAPKPVWVGHCIK